MTAEPPSPFRRALTLPSRLATDANTRHFHRVRLTTPLALRRFRRRAAHLRRNKPGSPLILVALTDHIGDVVASEPITRRLRAEQPSALLVRLIRHDLIDLVRHDPNLDDVWTVECVGMFSNMHRALTRPRIADQLIDLHVPGRDCDRCRRRHDRSDTAANTGIDLSTYYTFGDLLSIQCRVAGLPDLDESPTLHLPASAHHDADRLALPQRFVVFHCTSNQERRDWRPDAWDHLAERLRRDLDLAVVEVGARPTLTPAPHIHQLAGRLTLLQTAAALRRAAAFVGIDSGPAHIAHAVRAPAVLILGRYDRYPRYMPYAGAYADGSLATVLHHHGPARDTPVDTVYAALRRRLEHPTRPPADTTADARPHQ